MAIYVLAEAKDGYRVVFALAELDPAFTDSKVLVAYAANGKKESRSRDSQCHRPANGRVDDQRRISAVFQEDLAPALEVMHIILPSAWHYARIRICPSC